MSDKLDNASAIDAMSALEHERDRLRGDKRALIRWIVLLAIVVQVLGAYIAVHAEDDAHPPRVIRTSP